MTTERVQRQIDRLLDETEEAMANDDWATVSSRAKAVLALDPDNKDGQVYPAASERAQGSSSAATGEGPDTDESTAPASSAPAASGPDISIDPSPEPSLGPAKYGVDLPSGLITYLFTDVQGSTPLWRQHPHEMQNVMARHDSLMTSAVETNGGTVVRPRGEGDSIFAVFLRATDAVAAACAAQLLLQRETWPLAIAINVRMAIHTGESELRDHDYYGNTVNRCARLRSIAHGGQILTSEATAQLVRDDLSGDISLRELGAHRLKDLQRPEQVFQLIHTDLPEDFPALNSLDAHPHNLPIQLTSFIGRDDEIDEVRSLLSNARLVTLAGAGGSGKTRLSQEIGASVIEEYPDGVWFDRRGSRI